MLASPPASSVLTAKDAIARHMQWRMTLQLAITRKEPLAADQWDQIRHDDRCAIGRWLVSSATSRLRHEPAYNDLVQKHARFHRCMEHIGNLIAQQRFSEAERAIAGGSAFDLASQAIAGAIMAVNRIQAIAIAL